MLGDKMVVFGADLEKALAEVTLKCCLCSLEVTPYHKPRAALTVIGGFAVCLDHVKVVARGPIWADLQAYARSLM